MNVFKNPWKFYRAPFKWFEYLFRSFKYAYQRAVKGYCDLDLWELYTYYTNVIAGTLHELAENHMGYVEELGDEGWTTTLHEIATHFEKSLEENEMFPQPKTDEWYNNLEMMFPYEFEKYNEWKFKNEELSKAMCEEVIELDKLREAEKDMALDMLKKYWFNLWD